MKTSKKLLSLLMALIMVSSVISVGFTVNAASSSSNIVKEIVLEPIARPKVTFTCTEITRVAKAVNSMEPGTTIVKATPSGVPQLSGSYAAQAYAGETPEATKIVFKSNTVGITPKKLSCTNETIVLSDLVYNGSDGTYTCEIVSGTAEAGTAITFTIDYEWTDGNSYQEKCVTFVEGIANGGSYVEAKCDIHSLSGTSTRLIVLATANTRVLGTGVYYEQPAEIVTSESDPYRTYGVYNPATGELIENVASGYNTSIFMDDQTAKPAGQMNIACEIGVPGTSLAHIYIDSSVTKTLDDANIRIDINVGSLSSTGNSNPYTAIADTWVSSGVNVDSLVTTNDTVAQSEIGLTIPTKQDHGVKQFQTNASMTSVTAGAGAYQDLYTYNLTGRVANLVDGASYTVTSKYYSYLYANIAALRKFNMTSAATTPTAMTFHIVDKGALRELINTVMTSDPDTPAQRTQKKGANPQAWFYKSGFSQFQTAYVEALRVYNNPKATQAEIDAATKSLQTMYNNLQLKTADYTRVNELNTQANAILKKSDAYSNTDIALIEEAQALVTKNYSILYQGAVDQMADNLERAINNATPLDADYEEIYIAKLEIRNLKEDEYTPESWQALQDAVNAVDYNKTALEQNEVDAMAKAINDAIKNLKIVLADFTALEEKLEEAKNINPAEYINSEVLSAPISAAEAAIADNAANPWRQSKQSQVDSLTKNLDDAIKTLILKSAYKVALKEAIDAEIPGKREYYNQSILNEYELLVWEGTTLYDDESLTVYDQVRIDAKTAEILEKYAQLMASYDDSCRHTGGSSAVIENDFAPTCTKDGGYDMVLYCSDCGEEIYRQTYVRAATGHRADKAVAENEKEADCVNNGGYDMVVYCKTCGDEISRETTVVDAWGHKAGDTVIENEVAPDCVNDGSYETVVYCKICGEEISRTTTVIDALGHTEAEPVEENRVEATNTEAGSYDLVVYCTVCGGEISRETIVIPMLEGYFKEAEGSTTVINEELGYIYGLDIGLSDLEGFVEYSKSVTYETPDGIGTGMILTTFRDGIEWETYVIVIFGDLNGDGVIDIYDSSILAAIVNGDMELEEGDVLLFAADLNGDTAVDIYDLAILNSVVNGETEIAQIPMV